MVRQLVRWSARQLVRGSWSARQLVSSSDGLLGSSSAGHGQLVMVMVSLSTGDVQLVSWSAAQLLSCQDGHLITVIWSWSVDPLIR